MVSCSWGVSTFVRLPPRLPGPLRGVVDRPEPARARVAVPALRAAVARAASFPLGAPMPSRLGRTTVAVREAPAPRSGRSGQDRSVFTIVSASAPDSTTTNPSERYRRSAKFARSTLRLMRW